MGQIKEQCMSFLQTLSLEYLKNSVCFIEKQGVAGFVVQVLLS